MKKSQYTRWKCIVMTAMCQPLSYEYENLKNHTGKNLQKYKYIYKYAFLHLYAQ